MKYSIILFFIGLLGISQIAIAQKADILITNALILDGSGQPPFLGGVAIRGEKILDVGDVSQYEANRIIDAYGLAVAPGFIDVHAHIEGSILQRPLAANFVRNGVTTLVTGNCGSSRTDLREFFREVKAARPALNVASLIGHNSVRRDVMGTEDRPPSEKELEEMKQLVARGMKDGAVGFSTGLIYVPGTYSETDEVISLAKVASEKGGIYASHIRNEGNEIEAAIREAVQVGIDADMPVEISHFKISSKVLWGQSNKTTGMIKEYRDKGVVVTVDQYPYPASSTTLAVLLPTWALSGGNDSLNARLNDPGIKKEIIEQMKDELKANGLDDYNYCAVANCPWNQDYNGMRINEISQQMHGSQTLDDQIETVLEMVRKGDRVQMVFHKMSEEDVRTIMKYEHTMIASDAGIPEFGERVPHPRAYGTNSRVLGKYVRDEKLIPLETAIKKMTSMPASVFQLHDRGLVAKGMAADLVIFDPLTIADEATFERPHAYASGILFVLVNGQIALKNGQQTPMRNGSILKLSSK